MKALKIYEKPMLQSVAIQSNKTVADVCWGEGSSGSSPWHYYDSEGHGFMKFKVTTPDCKAWDGELNVYEYTCLKTEQGEYASVWDCPETTQELVDSAMAEFDVAFTQYFASVSNHGSPAHGFSDTFPPDPHGMS